ncbi:hypothetical protein COO60DRAFT_643978 [Scenedesmus sp. NREL 46B-D3]|nr:hypothetical protein COO60DRAFT_643978 [Scenedesmus sp. NREL 46B-D3]
MWQRQRQRQRAEDDQAGRAGQGAAAGVQHSARELRGGLRSWRRMAPAQQVAASGMLPWGWSWPPRLVGSTCTASATGAGSWLPAALHACAAQPNERQGIRRAAWPHGWRSLACSAVAGRRSCARAEASPPLALCVMSVEGWVSQQRVLCVAVHGVVPNLYGDMRPLSQVCACELLHR